VSRTTCRDKRESEDPQASSLHHQKMREID
jgi:hypothetical protein